MPTRRFGVDLGTANVRLFARRQGLLVDEPSAIAWVPHGSGEVLAIGHRALEAASRLPLGGVMSRPIASPAIADLPAAAALVHHLVDTAIIGRSLFRPQAILAVPPGASTVERRTLTEAAIAAGARRSWLVDEAVAAALGAGLQPSAQRCAVLDIGAGAAQLAVLDHTGTVVQESFPEAGGALDRALVDHFASRLALRLEPRAAEQLKRAVGSALPLEYPLTTEVSVASLDGEPLARRRVTSGDVAEALAGPLERLVTSLRIAIDGVPASHRGTIADRGLVLVGGGAQLRGLDRFLAERLEVRVRLAPDPQTCVVRGSVLALETMRVFRERLLYLS